MLSCWCDSNRSNFKKDLQCARRKYTPKAYPEARKELGIIHNLHNRVAWVREGIVHGVVYNNIAVSSAEKVGDEYRGEGVPTNGYYSVKSGKREMRLDDVDGLTKVSALTRKLLFTVCRFRTLVQQLDHDFWYRTRKMQSNREQFCSALWPTFPPPLTAHVTQRRGCRSRWQQ